jgi:hypothetical protein
MIGMIRSLQYYGHIGLYKRLTGQTPFKIVYGQEVVIPLHFWENDRKGGICPKI